MSEGGAETTRQDFLSNILTNIMDPVSVGKYSATVQSFVTNIGVFMVLLAALVTFVRFVMPAPSRPFFFPRTLYAGHLGLTPFIIDYPLSPHLSPTTEELNVREIIAWFVQGRTRTRNSCGGLRSNPCPVTRARCNRSRRERMPPKRRRIFGDPQLLFQCVLWDFRDHILHGAYSRRD